jgi:hypothetical protein
MTTDQREQIQETIYHLKIERAKLDGKIEALEIVLEEPVLKDGQARAAQPAAPKPMPPERPPKTGSSPKPGENGDGLQSTTGRKASPEAIAIRRAILAIIRDEVAVEGSQIRQQLREQRVKADDKDITKALTALRVKNIIEKDDDGQWSLVSAAERNRPAAPVRRQPRGEAAEL